MKAQKIQAARWKVALAFVGVLIFTAIGGLMLFGDTSIFEKLVGILSLIFFGGFGLPLIFSALVRGDSYLLLNQAGIQLHYPNSPSIFLAWQDIENFGTYEIGGQKLTTIRLNNYDQLLQTLRPAEVQKIIRHFKRMKLLGQATIAIGGPGAIAISKLLPSATELRNLTALLQASRDRYGGEFQIGWNMRDRKASEFVNFLYTQKSAYTGTDE